jgi:Putative addiction module component
MAKKVDKLAEEIHGLPDIEKLRLVDAILNDLDKSDPEIDRVWAVEARTLVRLQGRPNPDCILRIRYGKASLLVKVRFVAHPKWGSILTVKELL